MGVGRANDPLKDWRVRADGGRREIAAPSTDRKLDRARDVHAIAGLPKGLPPSSASNGSAANPGIFPGNRARYSHSGAIAMLHCLSLTLRRRRILPPSKGKDQGVGLKKVRHVAAAPRGWQSWYTPSMRDTRNDKKSPANAVGAAANVGGRAGDAASQKLSALGRKFGNDAVQQRIQQGSATRDDMLQFLVNRLGSVKEAQAREVQLLRGSNDRDWWKDVSDKHNNLDKPTPARWGETARLYEYASSLLCAGQVSRGAQVLKQALSEEQSQFDRVTKLIDTKDLGFDSEQGSMIDAVSPGEACAPCDDPAGISMAKEIQNVSHTIDDPPVKQRVLDPWWTEEEEEEEEKPDGQSGTA